MRRLCIMLRCSLIHVQVSAPKGKDGRRSCFGQPSAARFEPSNPPFSEALHAISKGVVTALLLASSLLTPFGSLAAESGVGESGEICILQSEAFGCKDASPIKRWVDLYVEENRESADRFIAAQVEAGQCAVFKPGDRLRILRYVGMRRLEVQRAGETERFIMLLK
jgi:hypothetical protein